MISEFDLIRHMFKVHNRVPETLWLASLPYDIVGHIASFVSVNDLLQLALSCKNMREHAIHTLRFQALLLSTPQFGTPENFIAVFDRFVVRDGLNIDAGVRILHSYMSVRYLSVVDGCVAVDLDARKSDVVNRWRRVEVAMTNATSVYKQLSGEYKLNVDRDRLIKVLAAIHVPLQVEILKPRGQNFKSVIQQLIAGDPIDWSMYSYNFPVALIMR